uniref:Uncharacterized protein n=1 Tax=Ciona savignyi TaxID=51511 RepID=H2Z5N9_CIOSA
MSLSGYVRKMENKNEFLVIPQLLTQQTCFKKLREDLSKQLKEFYKERGKNRSINTFVYEALQDSKCFEVKNGIYFRRKSVLRLEK